jgi:hypothetical protein
VETGIVAGGPFSGTPIISHLMRESSQNKKAEPGNPDSAFYLQLFGVKHNSSFRLAAVPSFEITD